MISIDIPLIIWVPVVLVATLSQPWLGVAAIIFLAIFVFPAQIKRETEEQKKLRDYDKRIRERS
jgi:hypothetical protein